jgi:16S rRNA (cytidine1402-2'-O)-methyltransferase
VEAVPGASAVLTALVASGLPTNAFAFLGFAPPRAQARERWLASLTTRQETVVFFEAPHRVRETLEAAARILGDRTAMVGRELTKLHEEKIRGRLTEILGQLTETRGEFTIVLAPADPAAEKPPLPDNPVLYREFCDLTESEGLGRRAAISRLAERYGVPSRLVYSAVERGRHDSGQ